MKDLPALPSLALPDHQRSLAVAQEAIPDPEGGNLGSAEARGKERVK